MSASITSHELTPRGNEQPPVLVDRELLPNEQFEVNLDFPLAGKQEVNDRLGMNGQLAAAVNAGGQEFLIIDVRNTGNNRDFYVVDDSFSPPEGLGYKGLLSGSSIKIGRGHHNDRFTYLPTVSQDHFEVAYEEEGLNIKNLRPTNATTVTAYSARPEPKARPAGRVPEFGRTIRAMGRISGKPDFGEGDSKAPYGYLLNHPILGRRSTSVDGGVYLGGSAREAIVVDGKSDTLKQVYAELSANLSTALKQDATLSLRAILLESMHKVKEVMPYDLKSAERISQRYHGDRLVGLSKFVDERAGVCRHQGLLASYLLERLISDRFLAGNVGIERNTVQEMGGTHAWGIFRPLFGNDGESIVIDPAQSFVGTKEEAKQQGRWRYYLSTDQY